MGRWSIWNRWFWRCAVLCNDNDVTQDDCYMTKDNKNGRPFRVLLIYANSYMDSLMPISVSSISGALKCAGIEVKLFDNTYYPPQDAETASGDQARVSSLQIPAFNYEKVAIRSKTTNVFEDFRKMVLDFRPDLIGLSAVEPTFLFGVKCLETIRDLGIPAIVGGVHTIFSPDDVIKYDAVDMVCIGEGEECVVELCRRMQKGEDYSTVGNIWVKKPDGTIVRNPKTTVQDMCTLPVLDFSIFQPERIFRPMAGQIHRMLPIEFSRGCVYKCTYCSAPAFDQTFKEQGRWLRDKPMHQIFDEINFYIKTYKVEYFYFVSETFLAMPKARFNEFIERYKEVKLPFWFNTRPETINEEVVAKLEEIGCHRISMGVEAGNEEYRKKMLKRPVSNKRIIEAAKILEQSTIQFSVNNIIGFPDETRDMIFDTIKLNREFVADSHGCYLFQPYRGTWLHEYSVSKGYWPKDRLSIDLNLEPSLDMRSITKEELKGLHRTFPLYIRFPEAEWPRIQRAEKFDDEGQAIFEDYGRIYRKKYFHSATLESPLVANNDHKEITI